MTEFLAKMGPHDMGGENAGPIDIVDHGMTHWEKHANAVRMTVSGKKLATLDEMRRACEDLGERYYELSYFERLTEALVIVLKEKNFFTEEIFNNKMVDVRERFNVPIISLPDSHDHDGKPIQEDEVGEGPNDHQVMNLAIQDLLQQSNLITANDIRKTIEKFDEDYPNRGQKVVVRAWTDEDFKSQLLEDANPAIESMGIDLEHAARLIVVENTDLVHNIIVCTLCSCYPRVLMGQPPTWYKSRSYRSRVVNDPRNVLKEFGIDLPSSITVRTHDSNADMRYMVLPQRPEGTEGWSGEKLESIISRDALVGVSIPNIEEVI
ncbi:MAG TPA: nitrile hydratase subunit beta [Rhodospirillales bacterium]|nr:nitrile hydratase subunit beta [Rhodospirillales bacterium]